jgi:nicotinamide-nucleotide amidase
VASVELIAVGTELLLGRLTDTNTPFVARRLAEIGITVRATHAVGDNRERIAETIADVLTRRDGVITTGGLGPTVDDLTKEAVCDALGLDVEIYQPALEQMERFFATIGRDMPPNNRKQANLPRGSVPLRNPNGTAPGFIAFSKDRMQFVACMPGPPREMKPMLEDQLVPFLVERFGDGEAIYSRELHLVGVGESEIDRRIEELFRTSENPKIAVLAHEGLVDIRITAKSRSPELARTAIAPLETEIERRLAEFVIGSDEVSLESAIHQLLEARRSYAATAESCTGGRVAAALTKTPGSSRSFKGGVVAYDNDAKRDLLGVDQLLIETEGAVSESVAAAMARGARKRFAADVAVATTGIAGPGGGSPEKPVGLVWLALDDADGRTRTRRLQLPGNRLAVQRRATTAALQLLWQHLRQLPHF